MTETNNTQTTNQSPAGSPADVTTPASGEQTGKDFIQSIVDQALTSKQQQTNTQQSSTQQQQTDTQQQADNQQQTQTSTQQQSKQTDLPKTQAEIDAIVTERANRAYAKGLAEGKDQGKSAAEKLAKMTDDEKLQAQLQAALDDNKALKAERDHRDMQATVLSSLDTEKLAKAGVTFATKDADKLIGKTPEDTNANIKWFNELLDSLVKGAKQSAYQTDTNAGGKSTSNTPNFGEIVAKSTATDPNRFKGSFFDQN